MTNPSTTARAAVVHGRWLVMLAAGFAAAFALGEVPKASADSARPRIELALGLGTELDRRWPATEREATALSLGTGAVMGECLGAQLGVTGNTRRVGMLPSRQRIELVLLITPVSCLFGRSDAWFGRVARSLAVGFGPGIERMGAGAEEELRPGATVVSQLDFPFSHPASPAQLALRVGARRFFGLPRRTRLGERDIGDTDLQAYGAFVVAF